MADRYQLYSDCNNLIDEGNLISVAQAVSCGGEETLGNEEHPQEGKYNISSTDNGICGNFFCQWHYEGWEKHIPIGCEIAGRWRGI